MDANDDLRLAREGIEVVVTELLDECTRLGAVGIYDFTLPDLTLPGPDLKE